MLYILSEIPLAGPILKKCLYLVTAILLLSMVYTQAGAAQVVVIVHPDNPLSTLTRSQLVDIYMGRSMNFPHGEKALPIDLSSSSKIRESYYQMLIHKSISQVNAFWARLMFSGRATPPQVLPDNASVIDEVMNNPSAIAYIDIQYLNDDVKVVYRLP